MGLGAFLIRSVSPGLPARSYFLLSECLGGDVEIGMRGLDATCGEIGFEGDVFEGLDIDVFFRGVIVFLFGLLLAAFAFLFILNGVDAGVGEVFDILGVLKIFGGLNLAGADRFIALTLNGREGGGDGGLGND